MLKIKNGWSKSLQQDNRGKPLPEWLLNLPLKKIGFAGNSGGAKDNDSIRGFGSTAQIREYWGVHEGEEVRVLYTDNPGFFSAYKTDSSGEWKKEV